MIPSILIAGPTASGKTDIAIELAMRVGGEIISVDSMQVYRGLDIGTAKPTADQRRRITHHLIDIVDVTEPFDAARYIKCAFEAIEIVRARGRLPILCGGTGLYFKALIHGVGHAPPPDPALRAELESTPLPRLLEELARRDPKTFENIDRQNRRRVVRALEVVILTGKPFSEQRAHWPGNRPPPPMPPEAPLFGIKREPGDLKARINVRTEQMFANGLVDETRRLLGMGLANNKTAMQALGYRQVAEYLRGERSLEETIALVKVRTWQFARRQMTWFKHQLPVVWIPVGADESPAHVATRILELRQKTAQRGAAATERPG